MLSMMRYSEGLRTLPCQQLQLTAGVQAASMFDIYIVCILFRNATERIKKMQSLMSSDEVSHLHGAHELHFTESSI